MPSALLTTPDASVLVLRAGLALLLGSILTAVAWRRCARLASPSPPSCNSFTLLGILEVFLVYLAIWIGTTTLAIKLSGAEAKGGAATTAAAASGLDVMTGFLVITCTNLLTVLYIITRNRQQGGRLADLGIRRAPLPQLIVLTLVMYIAFLPLAYGVGNVVDAVYAALGTAPPQQEAVKALQTDPGVFGNLGFILGVCLLTPILEEVFFRGFLYGVLRRFLGMVPSIVISAVLFGLLHDARVAMVLMLGGFLAFLYEKTGTLLAPILCHVAHNSLTILLLRLQG